MTSPNWSVSDVVAQRVNQLRKCRNVNRETLAERCAALGHPELTPPAIANIETGRRDAKGNRRRDVTIDELLILAAALRVPPMMLITPVLEADSIQILPGFRLDPWDGAKWISGRLPLDEETAKEWPQTAAPLMLAERHEDLLNKCIYSLNTIPLIEADNRKYHEEHQLEGELLRALNSRDAARHDIRKLFEVREEILRHGLTVPPLPKELTDFENHHKSAETFDDFLNHHPVIGL